MIKFGRSITARGAHVRSLYMGGPPLPEERAEFTPVRRANISCACYWTDVFAGLIGRSPTPRPSRGFDALQNYSSASYGATSGVRPGDGDYLL
jgi:hypothetical protein